MSNKYKIIQYHTSWSNYGRDYQVADLPAKFMHEISYAFFDLRQNPQGFFVPMTGDSWADFDKRYTQGRLVPPPDTWNDATGLFGNFGQLKKLKQYQNHLKLTLSVGGWTWSKNFSLAVRTPEARKAFVDACIVFLKTYSFFNGISLDWEYPSNDGKNYGNDGNIAHPDDDKNFLELLKDLRAAYQLNGFSNHTIAICCVAAPEKIKFSAKAYQDYIDEFHVMTYDFAGGWDLTNATHQTNVYSTDYAKYSVDSAVKEYLNMGVNSRKIFIGAAFYSRGFGGTDGLGKPAKTNSPDKSWEDGVVDYKKLPVAGATEMYDSVAHGAYSYDPVRKVLNTYDNVQSITEKCNYIKRNNLGGIIAWESSGDFSVDNPRSLTRCLWENLVVNENSVVPVQNSGNQVPVVSQPSVPVVSQPSVPVVSQPSVPVVSQPNNNTSVNSWAPNQLYVLGQTVQYKNKHYTIVQPHQSLVGWEPDVVLNILWREVPAPVQQAPVQQVPVQQTPVQQAPVQQVPVQQVPVQQVPVQQTPVQQVPVQQTPVPNIPVQQTPVPNIPVQPPASSVNNHFDVDKLTDEQLDRLFVRLFERHTRKRT